MSHLRNRVWDEQCSPKHVGVPLRHHQYKVVLVIVLVLVLDGHAADSRLLNCIRFRGPRFCWLGLGLCLNRQQVLLCCRSGEQTSRVVGELLCSGLDRQPC